MVYSLAPANSNVRTYRVAPKVSHYQW